MSVNEIQSELKRLHDKIVFSDYQKMNYPTCIEDVVEKLDECIKLLK